jgi:hypothetical protein
MLDADTTLETLYVKETVEQRKEVGCDGRPRTKDNPIPSIAEEK